MDKLANIPMDYLPAWLAVVFALGLIAFVIAAGVLAGALKNIKSLFEKQVEAQQMGPQPFEVKPHTSFATEKELKRVEAKVDKVEAGLASLSTAIAVNGDARRQSIEAKVESARKENASLTEAVRKELSEQISGVEGRVIATLKNTGAI